MPEFVPVLKKEEIEKKISILAQEISSDYKDKDLVLIGVLKGAFVFLSDLMRRLEIPVQVDFVGVSSYGGDTSSSGNIRLTKQIELKLEGKHVILVEDIIDTGLTLNFLVDYLKSFTPQSVKVCAMIDKHQRRQAAVVVDYAGHTTDEGFLVGYGLDYAEQYRNLPDIYHLKF